MITAADSMPDLTGCVLDNRYELLQMLGSGTYGVVYKALDTHSSSSSLTYRAIKIISKARRKSTEIATIRREVASHSTVSKHPGVVSLIDAYDDNDYFYIILEYCPGGDLFEKICDEKAYEGKDSLLRKAFVSLVDAVQACHDANIAHRDLKPENLLTNQDGDKIYLADFGIATSEAMMEEFGCGTSIYISPECLGRDCGYKPYCPRASDIWALGVILINMITGRNPWQTPSISDPGFSGFLEDPDFLMDTLPLSEGAHMIIRRILTLNPQKRITLAALRRAILTLDTFFRPVECEPDFDTQSEGDADVPIWGRADWEAKNLSAPAGMDRSDTASTAVEDNSGEDIRDPSVMRRPPTPEIIVTAPSAGFSGGESMGGGDWDSADSSLVVTPEGTNCIPAPRGKGKDIGDIDWRKGSTAQMLIERYRMKNSGLT